MHKIYINLHNLKTALIFSIEISWDYRLDMVYVCAKLHNFSPLRGRDPRGRWNPLPPGCEMGSKDPAFLGLKNIVDQNLEGARACCDPLWIRHWLIILQ